MQDGLIGIVYVPIVVSCVFFALLFYLDRQILKPYLRCWLVAWGAYTLHTSLRAWQFSIDYSGQSMLPTFILSQGLQLVMAVCTLRAAQEILGRKPQWSVLGPALGLGLLVLGNDVRSHFLAGRFDLMGENTPSVWLGAYVGVLLFLAAGYLIWYARRESSLGLVGLASSLSIWGLLLISAPAATGFFYGDLIRRMGHPLGTLPQVLVGLAQVVVLFEDHRREILENAQAFSSLHVGRSGPVAPQELAASLEGFLANLVGMTPGKRGILWIRPEWQGHFSSVQVRFDADFLTRFSSHDAPARLAELANAHSGAIALRGRWPVDGATNLAQDAALQKLLASAGVRRFTVLSLRTREHDFGAIVLADAAITRTGGLGQAPLVGLAIQIALSLEHHVAVQDAHRRTREYALLAQIGQAIAAHLDEDALLGTIHRELGQLLDSRHLYIAFRREDGQIQFRAESGDSIFFRPRTRARATALVEFMLTSGKPMLVRSNLREEVRRLAPTIRPPRPAKSLCAVPISLAGETVGVIAAVNPEHEFAFQERDLEIMQTVAGQVSVAIENARLFAEEQRRSRHFALLNRISELAIASATADDMLRSVVEEVQRHFGFDLVTVGMLDYTTKEMEIRGMAGAVPRLDTTRSALGLGILGRVARTSEPALVLGAAADSIHGMLPGARSAICVPLYAERILGVLCAESYAESAFTPQDFQVMKTLGDLLGAALHNVIIFQNMQHQSITDSLTGVKTRRFFLEALHQEWKRSSRSGRPFSLVMVDLDNFKQVNDSCGHMEGDLLLARVGRQIEERSRHSNVVARYGGDEFVVLMPETSIDQAEVLADRLRRVLTADPVLAEQKVTASMGVASFPLHGFTSEEVLRAADLAMYAAKSSGGNRVVKAEDLNEDEPLAVRRQIVSSQVDGFLQRERATLEDVDELVDRLRMMAGTTQSDAESFLKDAIDLLNRASEAREAHGAEHAREVERYAAILGHEMGFAASAMAELAYAARMHDIGKIVIPEAILNKPSMLTEEEFSVVKLHSQVGAEILELLPGRELVCLAVRHHHEAYDGSGYPDALSGTEIPLLGRILCVADAFANMVSDRPFAAAKNTAQAIAEIARMSGTRFDPQLAAILVRRVETEVVISTPFHVA